MALQIPTPSSIIHAASITAAGIGAGLAQLPGSDAPILVGIQSAMVMAIADHYRVTITQAAATQLVLSLSATMVGRGLSQVLIGWIPGVGNAVNGATAAAVTEAVGWGAVQIFQELSE
jgi:uncharacterized protein (DUF697 family)